MMYTIQSFTIFILLWVSAAPYRHFRDRIPNGHRLVNPCFEDTNSMWEGVGHQNVHGGGPRNLFGDAFARHGYQWSECLCLEDSDGDGMTNGEELGDPDCNWEVGQQPPRVDHIKHPGVCEPLNDSACMDVNSFLDCSATQHTFECDALDSPDVKNITLQFTETPVPAKETTYICQAFNLPSDGDYHLIATKMKVDNEHVMHHAILFGCSPDQETAALKHYSEPSKCGMSECTDFLSGWTLGLEGHCFGDEFGMRIGNVTGYRTVILEFHWNNPESRSDYTDSSAMVLYYTDKLRANDGGVMYVQPLFLQIPPNIGSHTHSGGCSSECTNEMLGNNSIYLADLLPHMHYLGSHMQLVHRRNGTITVLHDDDFLYDSPEIIPFGHHFELLPGDELKVSCTFSSKTKPDAFTYFGQATSDEMCIAILVYYPYLPTIGDCVTTNNVGLCAGQIVGDPFSICDTDDLKSTVTSSYANMYKHCDPTGLSCFAGCEEAIMPVTKHPCMDTPAADALKAAYMTGSVGHQTLNMLASCDPKPVLIPGDIAVADKITCEINEGITIKPFGVSSFGIVFGIYYFITTFV